MGKVRAKNFEHKGPGKVTPRDGVSNQEFAKLNDSFIQCCIDANVEATPRQASKFRNKKGAAYKARVKQKQK